MKSKKTSLRQRFDVLVKGAGQRINTLLGEPELLFGPSLEDIKKAARKKEARAADLVAVLVEHFIAPLFKGDGVALGIDWNQGRHLKTNRYVAGIAHHCRHLDAESAQRIIEAVRIAEDKRFNSQLFQVTFLEDEFLEHEERIFSFLVKLIERWPESTHPFKLPATLPSSTRSEAPRRAKSPYYPRLHLGSLSPEAAKLERRFLGGLEYEEEDVRAACRAVQTLLWRERARLDDLGAFIKQEVRYGNGMGLPPVDPKHLSKWIAPSPSLEAREQGQRVAKTPARSARKRA